MPNDAKIVEGPAHIHAAPSAAMEAVRQAYYSDISAVDMAPLWVVLKDLVPSTPTPSSRPALWRFAQVLPMLLRAGDVITAEEAERRVLVLENPALRGQSRITNTLYAGLQLILPGEVAEAHRHTAAAIRFILKGDGAYTAVDGEQTLMRRGDFVMTPSWTWHDHGNTSPDPMVWLDVLDLPTTNFFNAGFQEYMDSATQRTARQDGHSYAQYGAGVLPSVLPEVTSRSPIINYPYAQLRPVLARMVRAGEIDAAHGARVRYANPLTGGWAMPTMGPCLSMLPAGFAGTPYRATDATIFACVEGQGTTIVEDGKGGSEELRWTDNDVFTVPSWARYRHVVGGADAVLFSISDRPAQESLALWRAARG